MALPVAFLKARRAWTRTPLPVPNSRQNRSAAPTYGIELDLDHLASSISTYIDDLMTRRRWNHLHFAEKALLDLGELERRLDEIRAVAPTDLITFISLTRNLLEELAAIQHTSESNLSTHDARDELVATCHSLLNSELTVLEASAIISRLGFRLDPDQEDPDLLAFAAIDSEEDHLMTVNSEIDWRPEGSEALRAERDAAEAFRQSRALAAARALVARYGSGSA